ncbi:MAG: hypothetical protein PWR03_1030 [Tenuifilum sp.]|jgi:hypothetical protein|uniref:HAD family hydrolase n=1 Tax=Tenuifilum sp. TaxID=2760880 RepID=UPI0024ABF0F6|nr:HAD family hydrolase [Tenuifilum sp.]MDI3526847.1 hypothetical protein [Tenuifilum sp.]
MIKLVATDLDGTLLRSDLSFNKRDIMMLEELGRKGVVRVIATGRSPYSASTVLDDNFPIDFLVFSSGAGVMRWSDKSIIHTNELSEKVVNQVVRVLLELNVDFMIHEPIPLNHCFHFHKTGNPNADFDNRISLYKAFSQPFAVGLPYPGPASQILSILPNNIALFNRIAKQLGPNVQVIRATSPLDGESIWMEIFPLGVSKSNGLAWLCENECGILQTEVLAIGNDYNDLDMLKWAGMAFVVDNAPDELKSNFNTAPTNNNAGFSFAVNESSKP